MYTRKGVIEWYQIPISTLEIIVGLSDAESKAVVSYIFSSSKLIREKEWDGSLPDLPEGLTYFGRIAIEQAVEGYSRAASAYWEKCDKQQNRRIDHGQPRSTTVDQSNLSNQYNQYKQYNQSINQCTDELMLEGYTRREIAEALERTDTAKVGNLKAYIRQAIENERRNKRNGKGVIAQQYEQRDYTETEEERKERFASTLDRLAAYTESMEKQKEAEGKADVE